MSLEKTKHLTDIQIENEYGAISFGMTVEVKEDGKVIASSIERTGLVPGDNLSEVPAAVRQAAEDLWTPELIARYEAKEQELEQPNDTIAEEA